MSPSTVIWISTVSAVVAAGCIVVSETTIVPHVLGEGHIPRNRTARHRQVIAAPVIAASYDAIVSTPKILLCDDSPLVRAVVSHHLTQKGWGIATVDDPKHLADAVAKESPTLLLVDATYPGVDHDQLEAFVRPHAATHPVVVFSDRPEAELEILAKRLGAVGLVPKDAGETLPARLTPFLPG